MVANPHLTHWKCGIRGAGFECGRGKIEHRTNGRAEVGLNDLQTSRARKMESRKQPFVSSIAGASKPPKPKNLPLPLRMAAPLHRLIAFGFCRGYLGRHVQRDTTGTFIVARLPGSGRGGLFAWLIVIGPGANTLRRQPRHSAGSTGLVLWRAGRGHCQELVRRFRATRYFHAA